MVHFFDSYSAHGLSLLAHDCGLKDTAKINKKLTYQGVITEFSVWGLQQNGLPTSIDSPFIEVFFFGKNSKLRTIAWFGSR